MSMGCLSKFSVIIPSYNEGAWLEKTVRGVLENTHYPDFEIIVVADRCTDGSTDFLKQKKWPNVRLLEMTSQQGAIKTRNLGAKEASGELLVFIDSHEIPLTENWLEELARLLALPNVGAATLKIPSLEEKDRVGFLYSFQNWELEPSWMVPSKKDVVQKTLAIPGGCFGIQKTLFDQLGGFDEGLKKWGREDFEFSLRIWRMGYDLMFSPKAAIGHSFERKRHFKISYKEVDYNTLRVALTLFSKPFLDKVVQTLQKKRPQEFLKHQAFIEKNENLWKRKKHLESLFQRDFEQYVSEFQAFLPELK